MQVNNDAIEEKFLSLSLSMHVIGLLKKTGRPKRRWMKVDKSDKDRFEEAQPILLRIYENGET